METETIGGTVFETYPRFWVRAVRKSKDDTEETDLRLRSRLSGTLDTIFEVVIEEVSFLLMTDEVNGCFGGSTNGPLTTEGR